MKSIRTWSHRKYFWLGLVVIVLIVGARVAWVEYTRRSPYYFAKRRTDFKLLGKPYKPKWELACKDDIVDPSVGGSFTFTMMEGRSLSQRISGRQTLMEDHCSAFLYRHNLDFRFTASYEMYQHCDVSWVSCDCEDFCQGKCRAQTLHDFDYETNILTVNLIETFRNVSRKATFGFRLTEDGFVALVDGEE